MTVEEKSSLLLKKKDLIPTEIAEHFNFTFSSLISPTYIERSRFDNRKQTRKKQVLFFE